MQAVTLSGKSSNRRNLPNRSLSAGRGRAGTLVARPRGVGPGPCHVRASASTSARAADVFSLALLTMAMLRQRGEPVDGLAQARHVQDLMIKLTVSELAQAPSCYR